MFIYLLTHGPLAVRALDLPVHRPVAPKANGRGELLGAGGDGWLADHDLPGLEVTRRHHIAPGRRLAVNYLKADYECFSQSFGSYNVYNSYIVIMICAAK